MQAIAYSDYGSPGVLQLKETPKPQAGIRGILIRVRAAGVSAGDCELRRGVDLPHGFFRPALRLMLGWRRPRRAVIPGMYLAGEVEAVGSAASRFKPGDRVFGTSSIRMGACAEYVVVPASATLSQLSDAVTFEAGAGSVLGGLNALHFIRRAALAPGERILINGAAGSIGTFAVQLAHHTDAEITAVDHRSKLDLLRRLGAASVIDFTSKDFTDTSARYDVILDIAGTRNYAASLSILNPGGRLILANPLLRQQLRAPWTNRTTGFQVIHAFARESQEELDTLADMLGNGALRTVIDRSFPLEHTAAAHGYIEQGLKQGNVIIIP